MLNVQQIFDLGIKMGIAADPRGKAGVERYFKRLKQYYAELPEREKKYYDQAKLTNPYADSAIHVNTGLKQVKRVMAGIDVGAADILTANALNGRGRTVDLVIAHHPVGKALANLHEVMEMTADMFESLGLPSHVAEKITEERMREVERSVHAVNHYQAVNVAELLGVNFINTHTITDNLVDNFIVNYLNKHKPDTVGDLMDVIMEIPEYQLAKKQGAGPFIMLGNRRHRVGKFVVEMTGGTEPSAKVYKAFSRAGVSTVISMHMRPEPVDRANESLMNVVILGHISSDSLGMNLFLDELEKQGIEVVPCGGLIRVSRISKAATKSKKR